MKKRCLSILLILVLLLGLLPVTAMAVAADTIKAFSVYDITRPIGGTTDDDYYSYSTEPYSSDNRMIMSEGGIVCVGSFDSEGDWWFDGTFEGGKTYYLYLAFNSNNPFDDDCTVTVSEGNVTDILVYGNSIEVIISLTATSDSKIDSLSINGIPRLNEGQTIYDYFDSTASPTFSDPRVVLSAADFLTADNFDAEALSDTIAFESGKTYYLALYFACRVPMADNCDIRVSAGQLVKFDELEAATHEGAYGVIIALSVSEIYVGDFGMVSGQYLSNAGKLSKSKPSGGYAYYKSGVLTLSDYSYRGDGAYDVDGEECYDLIHAFKDLTLVLKGKNTMVSTAGSRGYGVFAMEDLTIKQDTSGGSLNLTTQDNDSIYVDGDLTINSGTIVLDGGANGIYVYGDMAVDGGNTTAKGTDSGITSEGDKIAVNGGTLTAISASEDSDEKRHAVRFSGSFTYDAEKLQATASKSPSGKPTVEFDRNNLLDYDYLCISPKTYTVTFAAGEGTGNMDSVTGISGEYTLPENGFTAPEGKQFKAWNIASTEMKSGEKITVSNDITVTAVWEDIPSVPAGPTEPDATTGPSEPADPTAPNSGNGGSGEGEPDPEEPNLLWLWILLAILFICCILFFLFFAKKKKKEEE